MYSLIAEYPRQDVTRKRQYTGILAWAAYIIALGIPGSKPDEQWVKNWILATRIPQNPDMYVTQTISAMPGQPDIKTNIRQHLSAFNDEAVEASMDAQVEAAVGTTLPGYAASVITDSEVQAWYNANGFGEPPAATATV